MPAVDPFSFTAHGHAWVVQSWLVSLLYGLADKVAGLDGVRVIVGAVTVAAFAVIWRLSRPSQSVLVRVGIGCLALVVAADQWSGRPLVVGLIALGLTVLAGDGDLDPRWLLPIGWVWVNSHGSFPIGLAYLVVVALGRRLDGLDASIELRSLRWLGGGILLGAANPLGPKLLLFPAHLLQQQDVLRHVVEWQAPRFESLGERVFLLQIVLAIIAVARLRRYRSALIVAVFVAASLLGARNISVASVVLVPVLASAWPSVGELRTSARSDVARVLAALGVLGLAIATVVQLGSPGLALDAYPTRSLAYLDRSDVDLGLVRMASIDRVGNLLELRDGVGRRVFFDDRFDMYPKQVSSDVVALSNGSPRSTGILDRWSIDLVLWPRQQPLVAILDAGGRWRTLSTRDPGWVLLCRKGATLGSVLGTC